MRSFLVWLPCALHYQAGGSPAARHFILLRQNKVTKQKATRSLGPCAALRATCGARNKRGLARTRFAQTIASPDPLASPLLSPARTGWERKYQQPNSASTRHGAYLFLYLVSGFFYVPFWLGLAAQEGTDKKFQMSEGCEADKFLKFPSAPSSASCPEHSAGTQTAGRLSFGYFWCLRNFAARSEQTPRSTPLANKENPLCGFRQKCLACRGETRSGREGHPGQTRNDLNKPNPES